MDKQALETIEIEMAFLVRRITSIATDKKIGNLDRSAYLLLHQISDHHNSAGVKTLADEFRLDISTVSRQVTSLEQKGYVTRIPNPTDGRAYSLSITEAGMQELKAYKQARMETFKDLLKEWSEEECEMFGGLLKKFNRTYR